MPKPLFPPPTHEAALLRAHVIQRRLDARLSPSRAALKPEARENVPREESVCDRDSCTPTHYTQHSTQHTTHYTLRSTLYTLHSTHYTLDSHFTLYTLHLHATIYTLHTNPNTNTTSPLLSTPEFCSNFEGPVLCRKQPALLLHRRTHTCTGLSRRDACERRKPFPYQSSTHMSRISNRLKTRRGRPSKTEFRDWGIQQIQAP